ncbi:MAG TPA: hypothetical protein VK901_00255 [Nitrospiraceae bacterium]|nr:hypothetical protein [Nitrospiraceae bacterium]
MGAGQGFERGAHSFGNCVMAGIRLGMQQKWNDQLDEPYKHFSRL